MFLSASFMKLAVAGSLFVTSVAAIGKVSRAGKYLYNEDGSRFYIKGIAYQEQGTVVADPNAPFSEPSTFTDPLADTAACARDVPFLTELGVNAIRVYSVDSRLNHDSCMKALSDAGIYTIIDLSLPVNGSIDRAAPAWSNNLLDLYIRTIDTFAKYDNVLAYNVGNEIVTSANETALAPYIKAAARDTKAYLKSKSLTSLVGYSAINGASDVIVPLADFLACGSDDIAIDLYGLNNYAWCGADTFANAYASTITNFGNLNIPAYFSEFGCVSSGARQWSEVASLFSTDMSPVWSGGLAFSYFPATSQAGQFGMVTVSGNTVTPNADFTALATAYKAVTGPNQPVRASAGTVSLPTCPATSASFLASTTLPDTPSDKACDCVVSSLSCQFTPQTSDTAVITGQLINTACQLLGAQGGNCNDIGGTGSSGVYGKLETCSPGQKLSYVMTKYYEATNRNAQSCSFGGNGTVNAKAPSNSQAVEAAVTSCLASKGATFTPTSPGSSGSGGSSGGGTSGSGGSTTPSGNGNSASGVHVGLGLMMVSALFGGLWSVL